MKRLSFESKPYTVPSDNPTAEALIKCYWWDVARHPLLLANLRRPDGSLYLPKNHAGKHIFTNSIQPESERAS